MEALSMLTRSSLGLAAPMMGLVKLCSVVSHWPTHCCALECGGAFRMFESLLI